MKDCLFCKITSDLSNSKVIYEDNIVAVIMDINPMCDGHLLIIPKKHYTDVFELDDKTLHYMYEIANKMIHLLYDKLGIEAVLSSLTMGINK